MLDNYEEIVQAWKDNPIISIVELNQKLDNFRILFAYNSGKIENSEVSYHDTYEIFKNGKVINYTGDTRAIFEQQNQKMCYEFLAPKIVEQDKIDLDLIKEVHFLLTQGTFDTHRYLDNDERPGQFKKHAYVVGMNEVGAEPEEVPELLTELIEEIYEVGGNFDVLKAAAYFHAKFEYLHPFSDGNGRVGRTLLNYYLLTNDYPPLIVYEEDKIEYYKALQQYDELEELDDLYQFLKFETVKTWQKKQKKERPKKINDFLN